MVIIQLFSVFATIRFDDADFNRGIAAAEGKGKGFGSVMAGVGEAVVAAAAAMGAALVGIGVAAFNVGRDFDQSMGAIRAQTGLTADEIDKIGDGFREMALAGGFSARELASAFAGIAVYGQDTADALNIMSAAQTLAMATGEDLGSAAYFLGNYLLKVGKDSSYADKYIDLFAQGVRNTGIGLNDLQNYVFRMTPAFQQFGASSETNIAILTRLYQAGIRGANLYSGMGTIMMQAATGTGQFADMLSLLPDTVLPNFYAGMVLNEEQLFDLAIAMREYGDQTQIAAFVSSALTQTQQAAWFEFMNLAEEIQNEVIPSFNAYGVAAQMAEYSGGGMERSLRILGNTMEWARLKVWDFIAAPVAEALAGAAGKFQELATTFVPLFGGALQGLIGILTGAEGASDKFAESIGNIASEISKQLPVFLERGIDIVVNLITGVASAIPTLVAGVVEIIPNVARTLLDALPQIIDAGIGVIVALIDGVATMLPELVPIAIEGIITIVNAILDNLGLLIDAAIGLIGALAGALLDPANLAKLREAAPQLIKFFALYLAGKAALSFVGKAATAVVGKFKAGILGGKAIMSKAGKTTVGFFKGGITKAGAGIKLAAKGLIALLKLGFKGGKLVIKGVGKLIGAAFKGGVKAGAKMGKLGKSVISGLSKALKGGKGVMSKAAGGMAKSFTGALKGKGGAGVAAKAGKGLLAAIGPKGWIAGGIAAVGVVAYRNREAIGGFFRNMGDSARNAASSVWDATKGAAAQVGEFFGNVGRSVAEGAANIYNNVREFAGSVVNGAREQFQRAREVGAEMIETFSNGFNSRRAEGYGVVRSFFGGIMDTGRNVLDGMREIGSNAANSFSEGFESRRESGQGVVRSFFGGVLDAGRSVLGISSPSKEFDYFAEMSVEGYARKFENLKDSMYFRIESVFSDLSKAANVDVGFNYRANYEAFNPPTNDIGISMSAQGGATASPVRGGTTQNIYLTVKFDDIDQVSKLVNLFEGFSHNKLVFEGV